MGLFQKLFNVRKAVNLAAEKDKTILDKIVVNFGEVVTDKDETIMFDGDTLTENMPVFIEDPQTKEAVPVTSGTYILKTGETIEVVDGVCTKITTAQPADAPPANTPAQPTNAGTPPAASAPASTPKSTVERHEIETHFKEMMKPFEEKLDAVTNENVELKKKNEELEKKIVELEKQPADKAIDQGSLLLNKDKDSSDDIVSRLKLIRKIGYKK